jgi:hypothetical protein
LAVILDAFSRKVVGWALDRTLAARLPISALERAFAQRQPPPGLVHHSDRGAVQRGCFRWPQVSPGEVKVRLTPEEFTMLIGGMDLQATKPRPWYRKEIDEVSAPRMNPA